MNTRLPAIGLAIALAACGGTSEPPSTTGGTTESSTAETAPPNGEAIFSQTLLDGRPGCITCHSLEPDVVLVGPSMVGVVARGEAASPGDPAAYIRESIAVPDADILEGYQAGSMPQADLTDAEVDALVNYLLEVGA